MRLKAACASVVTASADWERSGFWLNKVWGSSSQGNRNTSSLRRVELACFIQNHNFERWIGVTFLIFLHFVIVVWLSRWEKGTCWFGGGSFPNSQACKVLNFVSLVKELHWLAIGKKSYPMSRKNGSHFHRHGKPIYFLTTTDMPLSSLAFNSRTRRFNWEGWNNCLQSANATDVFLSKRKTQTLL